MGRRQSGTLVDAAPCGTIEKRVYISMSWLLKIPLAAILGNEGNDLRSRENVVGLMRHRSVPKFVELDLEADVDDDFLDARHLSQK
jgi:hypothetical protein